jgi:N-acetylglucosaminyldiphosphoundecaprenol N-acetyl-beta-D-mannosaminyltransferase
MVTKHAAKKSRIISLSVDNLSFTDSLDKVKDWGLRRQSGFICFANVHMIIEAYNDRRLSQDLNKARLVLPDGLPLAVACSWLYKRKQERVSGMDFMPALLEEISKTGSKVFLFGSTANVLDKLVVRIQREYPGITVAGSISPPFSRPTEKETEDYVRRINESGANFILVALGCPKQERWMAEHFPAISGIMLGLGGAFSVFAGIQKRCPVWMRNNGLEWFYRLLLEPRRLFKRYCVTNLKFLYLFSKQMLQLRHGPIESLN